MKLDGRTPNLTRIPYSETRYLLEIRKIQNRLSYVFQLLTEINIDRYLVNEYGERGFQARTKEMQHQIEQQTASTNPPAGNNGIAGKS